MVIWIFVLGDEMFRVVLLGFLVFTVSCVLVPTATYAMSLDDDEEDAEDVADLLDQAKKAGKSESFSKANKLLEKAKMYGVSTDDTQEASRYVAGKKQAKDERLERERKEKERLARLKREKEKRARQARLARQREQESYSRSYTGSNYSSLSGGSQRFSCEYSCRTDEVFLSSYYDVGTVTISASSEYDAENRVKELSYKRCRSMRDKYGNLMRQGSVSCRRAY